MKKYTHRSVQRKAIFLAVLYIGSLLQPTVSWALTAGPSQPEFTSFEPIATTDMVDVFSGDFTYNLPVIHIPGGPDGGDYALSLSYHSGSGAEHEASWVGYGWTLNPGAINRGTRGFPDEYKGTKVTYYNKVKPNWTVSKTTELGAEGFSQDVAFGASLALTNRYNNYKGFSRTTGFSMSEGKGFSNMSVGGNIGISLTAGEPTLSAGISPSVNLNQKKRKANTTEQAAKMRLGNAIAKGYKRIEQFANNHVLNTYDILSFSEVVKPTTSTPYQGISFNYTSSLEVNPSQIPVGVEGGFNGNFNIQVSKTIQDNKAYGYMHTPSITTIENSPDRTTIMSDYYTEKSTPYSKRDYFIGIPFNNADQFILTGEGLGGSFRAYQANTGHFYPQFSHSESEIRQIGIELMVGANIGVGFDFGLGMQTLDVSDWKDPTSGNSSSYQFNATANTFRFAEDRAGGIEYSSSNAALSASVTSSNLGIPGAKKFVPQVDSSLYQNLNNGNAPRNSSHIEYHTFANLPANPAVRYNRNANTSRVTHHRAQSTNSSDGSLHYNEAIAEFATTNTNGVQHVYGLPVFSRNELSIHTQIENVYSRNPPVFENYLAIQDVKEDQIDSLLVNNASLVGEYKPVPYPTTYLLTQILSPDYVDLPDSAGDYGPSDNDFGGWTRFEYKDVYGGNSDWYNWRTPYAGLLYQQNDISDQEDDLGMLTKGEKEIYYLKAVETKTHVAFFITNQTQASDFADYYATTPPDVLSGSGQIRYDALGANPHSSEKMGVDGQNTNQTLEYLEKIVLFPKSRMDKPLKVAHFTYDYSLVKNLPNNYHGNWPYNPLTTNNIGSTTDYNLSGKLTLKKVWFEYEGIVNAKTTPYEFDYQYPQQYPAKIAAKYPEVTAYANQYTGVAQNPNYTPYTLDMWGNHQYNGKNRQAQMNPWMYQGFIPEDITDPDYQGAPFDPAAWQLKRIQLPSGGEIQVQYEQKDYCYVQDRKAMAMVSLLPSSNDGISINNYYDLNLEDMGLTPAAFDNDMDVLHDAIQMQADLIQSELEDRDEKKIYFKFLYALTGNYTPTISDCRSEYISGYTRLREVETDGQSYIRLKLGKIGKRDTPKHACIDYVQANRVGKIGDNNCRTPFSYVDDDLTAALDNAGVYTLLGNIPAVKRIARDVIPRVQGFIVPKIDDIGPIDPELSYLKVPLLHAKRGGGIRVKRLLMFDQGIENGAEVLYGNEYIYQTKDGKSSGVATNEPGAGREENALVTFLPRQKQQFLNKLIHGKDKKEAEGPLGESILPGASVGHSRVVIKNIHSGKTGTGYTVHEFHTAADYPFDGSYGDNNSEISGHGVDKTELEDNRKRDYMIISNGLFTYKRNKTWLAQGFRFIINDMHGQLKSQATFGGVYGSGNNYLSSSQTYNYYKPGEKLDMLYYNPNTENYTLKKEIPGKELDVTMEMNAVQERNMDLSLEVDVSVGLMVPPPVFISAFPSFELQETGISTHATTKVVRYPSTLKSVETFRDGAHNLTEYLAFDPNTGSAVITRNYDDYHGLPLAQQTHDGSTYGITLPAAWYYPDMGLKSTDPNNTNQLNASAYNLVSYGKTGDPLQPNWFDSPTGILSAIVQTYAKNWYDSTSNTNTQTITTLENNLSTTQLIVLNSKWKAKTAFTYRGETASANGGGPNKVYTGGIFGGFQRFAQTNWDNNTPPNSNWLPLTTAEAHDANGNPVSEKDILDRYSAARFGYQQTLPIMVAQNASYSTIQFADFEDRLDYGFLPNMLVSTTAHSGQHCLHFNQAATGNQLTIFHNLWLNDQLYEKGGSCKLWVKSNMQGIPAGDLRVTLGGTVTHATHIAQVGEWHLFDLPISTAGWGALVPSSSTRFGLILQYDLALGETLYLDDIRFQPHDAQASAFVYDIHSKRLLTQFDDQHFGLYKQYNQEGQLVRQQIETERGLKTIQETQYHTAKP